MPRWLPVFALPVAFALLTLTVPHEVAAQKKANASDPAEAAARAQLEKGLKVEVWAAEPLLENPVAFAFDEHGRCFVAETNRLHDGVPDTRGFMHWLDDDIGARSIADRLDKYKKHKYPDFTKFSEQLRIVWDSTGTGKADKSDVFATGFNAIPDGLAAGVLARKGTVYFTCIPDLYAFGADKDTSKATSKKSLATGFGIRDQFVGHDLHGLRMGPDGKLYFSIGDRGFSITTKDGKKLSNPDSGAVLRCDPDGSNMEIVHVGLRNPQELAFDDFGNLFTYDNNSDSGDQARWVQIVEGGDSGWRCGYQYGTLMHHNGVAQGNRGPWNTEKIWHVPGPNGAPPAYVVPPLLHFGNGPSGLTYYPGVGLSDRYKGHFFACDFTSNAGNSVIWSLAVKPKGASFEVVDLHPFVKNMVPTDCEFGPDGAFYWLDWVGGWNKPNKGRIFRVTDPEAMKNPVVAEAKKLLSEGFTKKTPEELAKLLEHPHREVRQEAQFELAGRVGDEVNGILAKVAKNSNNMLARIHAVWVLGRRGDSQTLGELTGTGVHSEVQVAVARSLRQLRWTVSSGPIREMPADVRLDAYEVKATLRLLKDSDPRVAAEAAYTYGRLLQFRPIVVITPGGEAAILAPLFEKLKSNDDHDAYLRHALVQSLTLAVKNPCDLLNAWKLAGAKYDTPAVRLGLVLALRKMQCRRLGEFLNDTDPRVAAEAARAIYDQELMTPMPDLAKVAEKSGLQEAVAYRALAANFRLGEAEHAARLAMFAARATEPDHLRITAMKLLADWAKPPRRDPITGLRMDLPERQASLAADAVRLVLAKLFTGSDAVRKEAVQLTAKLAIQDVGPLMLGIVTDSKYGESVRVEALFALEAVKATELAEATKSALAAPENRLRAAARVVKAKADPSAAAKELPALLKDANASLIEKQMALGVLGTFRGKEVDAALGEWLDQYAAGKVPAELKLDVLEAATARATAGTLSVMELRDKLKVIDQAARAAAEKDPLARHRESLAGGDAEKGRAIFLNNAAVYCQRCHKLDGQGGDVGPAMNGIAAKQTREYLLEAIVHPNTKIAEGYQSVILNLLDGKTVSGVLRAKDGKGYTIVTAENKVLTIPKDDVDSEKPDKSAMPDDLVKKLSKRELRDMVEFLTTLKEPGKK